MDTSPPDRRPRQRLSEEQRRKQIMEAAVQEVVERGYEGASLTRIAKRAGVAKGLVWHYFTDKDDLMESTAKQTMQAIQAQIVD
ncbi:helix-turn-helix domain containing protein [Nocardiopsis sp. RSe5-2]|uniref:Helix-turn-helix domain containing protein n=1 Tax=Nocardiopsis endophytica TaxID=3018445 RepID=A0ABT4U4G7_9ACTN|nr:helix-turn-helix domain-containing protein [Nocardiopsis endophytica]MDA2811340.1 helix-turn-helix domain containing protein [Nocardiopsis endophytica]